MLAVVTLALSLLATNASFLDGAAGTAASADQAEEAAAFHNILVELQTEFDTLQSVSKRDVNIPDPGMSTDEEEKEMEEALKEAEMPPAVALSDKTDTKAVKTDTKAQPVVTAKVATKAPVQPHETIKSALGNMVLENGKKFSKTEFEAAIGNLFKIGSLGLSKAEFDATPFGGSVAKIRDLIVDDMMPKVIAGHNADQHELKKLFKELMECNHAKDTQVDVAAPIDKEYKDWSPKHVTCRQTEAGKNQEKISCWEDEGDKNKVKELKCHEFAMVEAQVSHQEANKVIVTKGGSEAAETYVKRISSTICGDPIDIAQPEIGDGGFGKNGFVDLFFIAKKECERVTLEHADQKSKCQGLDIEYANKKKECDNLQDQMDEAACAYAIDIKDSCEEYAECFNSREEAFMEVNGTVAINEHDRHVEWKSLKRMVCLVGAFFDGKVENAEIEKCRELKVNIDFLLIDYPVIDPIHDCEVPKEYPSTSEYKAAQFASLPELAKGKVDANECTGVQEISTVPATGSPEDCKCERLTLNGPFSPGPLVKCVDCLDIRRTQDLSSCPDGTKLFSPRSQQDWKTFISSTIPLRAPHFVIDITRDENGCGGCTHHAMNSLEGEQKSWKTSDGSPWWLRSQTASEPNGDYHANCYMDLFPPENEADISFNDKSCDYHSKSYFCQLILVSEIPKEGSPLGCFCEKVDLTGHWAPKTLLKCKGCLEVSKSTQKNSCPHGTKIFAPSSREDWKTFLASATMLRAPNFIIDITRPQDGCGGCGSKTMNSDTPEQATWKTADGAPWWLRSTQYFQPGHDYKANCYMDIWGGKTENAINFGARACKNSASAYYCQLAKKR